MKKYIKKFESWGGSYGTGTKVRPPTTEELIKSYIQNSENFSDMEKIKDIFIDIKDFCYLNGLNPPKFSNHLDFNNNNSTKTDFKNKEIYRVIFVEISWGKRSFNSFSEIFETTLIRLKNFGFKIKIDHGYAPSQIEIYISIVDINNPITFKDLEENYNK